VVLLPLYFGGKTCFDQNAGKKLCDKIKEIFAAHFVTFFVVVVCLFAARFREQIERGREIEIERERESGKKSEILTIKLSI